MSTPRVLLVEDATFHRVAPLATDHIKTAFEAEGCQAHVIRESKTLSFQPSTFDLIARRNLKELIETNSDITVAAGPLRALKKTRRFSTMVAGGGREPGSPCPWWELPERSSIPPKRWGSAARTPPRKGPPSWWPKSWTCCWWT